MSVLVGNVVKVKATFKDETNVKGDPAVVAVSVQEPDATITTYVYGTDVEVVRESVGVYYIELDTTDQTGDWEAIWHSTGTLQAVGQTKFTVADTYFEVP